MTKKCMIKRDLKHSLMEIWDRYDTFKKMENNKFSQSYFVFFLINGQLKMNPTIIRAHINDGGG
jgi:hypothetical protein